MLRTKAEEYFKKARDAIQNKTETEKKLDEILSKKEWGASTTQMNEIARLTHDPMEYRVIMSSIWEALNEDGKNWRVILKALSLLEHLVKLGSERVVDDARTNMFRIRMYNDFTYRDDMGHDRGGGIREKATYLMDLLNSTSKVREERERARELQKKFIGVAGKGGSIGFSGAGPSSFHDRGGSGRFGVGSDNLGSSRRYGLDSGGVSPQYGGESHRSSNRASSSRVDDNNRSPASHGKRGRKPHNQRKPKSGTTQSEETSQTHGSRNGRMNIKLQSPSSGGTRQHQNKQPQNEEEEFSPFSGDGEDEFDPFEEPQTNNSHQRKPQSRQPAAALATDELDDVFSSPSGTNNVQNSSFDPFGDSAQPQQEQNDFSADIFAEPSSAQHGNTNQDPFNAGGADLFGDAPSTHDPFHQGGGQAFDPFSQSATQPPSRAPQGGAVSGDLFDSSPAEDHSNKPVEKHASTLEETLEDDLMSFDLNEEPSKKTKDHSKKQGPTLASAAKPHQGKRSTGLESSTPQTTPMQPPQQPPMHPNQYAPRPQQAPMYPSQYPQMPPQNWGPGPGMGPGMQQYPPMQQPQMMPQQVPPVQGYPQYYQQSGPGNMGAQSRSNQPFDPFA